MACGSSEDGAGSMESIGGAFNSAYLRTVYLYSPLGGTSEAEASHALLGRILNKPTLRVSNTGEKLMVMWTRSAWVPNPEQHATLLLTTRRGARQAVLALERSPVDP